MSVKKIGLLGAIGLPNLGDEAILRSNLLQIKKLFGSNAEIYVFTRNSSISSLMDMPENLKIHYISFLHDFIVENLDKIGDTQLLFDAFNSQCKSNKNLKSLLEIFRSLNYFQFIGGGYITSFWPDMIVECWLTARLLHENKVPYALTGQSFYLKNEADIKFVNEIVNWANLLDFRSKPNNFNIKNYNTVRKTVTIDDAIQLPYVKSKTLNYINVLIHPWREYAILTEDVIKKEIIPFLKLYLEANPGVRINILSFYEGDFSLWKKIDIDNNLDQINFIDCTNFTAEVIKGVIAGAIFNITSRFHAAVFSLSVATPVFSIYFDEYYKEKINSIHNIFNDTNVSSINSINLDALISFSNNIACIKENLRKRLPYVDELMSIKREKLREFYSQGDYKMIEPCISIIIPIYNMGPYLSKCLESVLSQRLNNIEIICVNDGSTDNSQEILNEYSWKDSRIKVLLQKNQGVSKSRNRALKLAKGKYVFFLDPDDWLPDDMVLKDLYTAAESHGVKICGGGFEEFRGNDLITEWKDSAAKYVFKKEGIVQYKDYQYDFGWVRFIYQRTLLIENNLYLPNLKFFEDPVFFVKTMHIAGEFYALNRMSYCYRSGHHSYKLSYDKVVDLIDGMTQNIKLAKENQYYELLRLELYRLTHDYAGQVVKFLGKSKSNKELTLKFDELNQVLGKDTRIEYEIFQSVIDWLNYQIYIHSSCRKVLQNSLKIRAKKYIKFLLPNCAINYIRKLRNK